MMHKTRLGLSAALGLSAMLLAPALASAQPYYHHAIVEHAPAYGRSYGHDSPYHYGYPAPGQLIAEAAARAQLEPGVTSELAPDAVQTATGGPSGGVPGFSGF